MKKRREESEDENARMMKQERMKREKGSGWKEKIERDAGGRERQVRFQLQRKRTLLFHRLEKSLLFDRIKMIRYGCQDHEANRAKGNEIARSNVQCKRRV